MDGQSKLYMVAAIVGIVVIVAMAITFAVLFAMYAKQRRRVLSRGLDDESLVGDLEIYKERYLKAKKRKSSTEPWYDTAPLFSVSNSRTILAVHREDEGPKPCYVASLERVRKKNRTIGAIGDVVYSIFVILALALAGFGLYMAVQNQPVFIGDTAYIVIQTGSMEEANPDNDYLEENDLTNQIAQYALIGIDRVDSIADVGMYDVVAFYDYDGNILVHRVVAIRQSAEGETILQTRGDANNGSLSDEMAIGEDRLIGIYDGYQNYGLGILVTYLKSTLGIIALCGFGAFLIAYSLADSSIEKAYEDRMEKLAEMKDESEEISK